MSNTNQRLDKAREYLRGEPKLADMLNLVENDTRIQRAYDFYREKADKHQQFEWVIDYLLEEDREDDVAIVRGTKQTEFTLTFCALARMQFHGIELPDSTNDFFDARLEKILEENEHRAVGEPTEGAKRTSPREHLRERISDTIGHIETELDKHFNDPKYMFDLQEFLKKHNLKGVYAERIYEYYMPKLVEVFKIKNARTDAQDDEDEQLKEAYERWSDDRLEKYEWFLTNLLEDAKTYGTANPSIKVRKKRKRDPSKIVSKVKYLKAFPDLGLTSLTPEKILGANAVWIFNPKYRVLVYYVASDESGLAIKGTTILGYDPNKSVGKKLRKPKEFLTEILNGGKVAAYKAFSALLATEQEARGRLNDDTLILRVTN